MRPLPQRYEITEWERQIVKEQEREREGPRASERDIKRPKILRGARTQPVEINDRARASEHDNERARELVSREHDFMIT